MPYGWQDRLSDLNHTSSVNTGIIKETFSTPETTELMELNEAKELFKDLSSANKNSFYLPIKMCHTLPYVNKRKRGITYSTAKRSIDSVRGSIVDMEHEMSDLGTGSDTICGYVVDCNIADIGEFEDSKSPLEPVPVLSLLALHKRSQHAGDIVRGFKSGEDYYTSMECNHNFSEGCFKVGDDFIPVQEAEEDLLRCFDNNTIHSYKGKDTSFILGGLDGVVSFDGIAITKTPADANAAILNVYAMDVNSTGRRKTFAVYQNIGKSLIDKANIVVVGKTQEADGHVHEVLSDGTVLAAAGHTHHIRHFNLTPGDRFTAVTSEHYNYTEGSGETNHLHLIDIPLKKKVKKPNVDANSKGVDMPLRDKTKVALFSKLDSHKDSDGNIVLSQDQAIELCSETAVLEAEAEVAEKVESGDLVPKEQVEEATTKAAEEAATKASEETKAKIEEEQKKIKDQEEAEAKVVSELSELLKAKGYSVDDKINDKEDAKTFKEAMEGFGLNEDGKEKFEMLVSALPEKKTSDNNSTGTLATLNVSRTTESKKTESKESDEPKFGKAAFRAKY